MRQILTIDGGWGGAMAYWVEESGLVGVAECPGDCAGILAWLDQLLETFSSGDIWEVIIEANHASPQFGARGNFGLGMNLGAWETALVANGLSDWENINPKTWQTVCSNERSRVRQGRKARKEKAWRFVKRVFPQIKVLGDSPPNIRSPIQGIADALAILEWARRRRHGEKNR